LKLEIIKKLNIINKKFYIKFAKEFDNTRQSEWQGWKEMLPYLSLQSQDEFSVLDIGCGNARFYKYLHNHYPQINYTGIDNNSYLIDNAKNLSNKPNYHLHNFDFVANNINQIITKKYNLIVIFGVLHHIPGFANRQNLILSLSKLLEKDGDLLVFSTWNFPLYERFSKRFIDWKTQNIDMKELEENDFLLDWQHDQTTPRYCHYLSESEVKTICDNVNIKIIGQYKADGKSGDLNNYFVCKR
jgi:tRNA (uracil-5-)-methyltransferase TRM9